MTGMPGAVLFTRFAFPPNSLGFCGPSDSGLLLDLIHGGAGAIDEVRHVIPAFAGAWPYLELIGHGTGLDPLDRRVVEAYWLGSPLLERIDLLDMGNSVDDRFRRRAGWDWEQVAMALGAGGKPTHSFHVFCIYPWVGLLQSGVVEQALNVLDRCRIRWGVVVGRVGERLMVRSQSLSWDGSRLGLETEDVESVAPPVDEERIDEGDVVAMHWDYVCSRITPAQARELSRYHDLHLAIANQSGRVLEGRLER